MKINEIISEEINKQIVLKENTALYFQELSNCIQYLKKYKPYLKDEYLRNSTSNKQIYYFLKNEFFWFTCSLIDALTRCVRSNSINESLYDLGFRLPPEMNRIGYKAKDWYYKTQNQMNKLVGAGRTNSNRYSYAKPIKTRKNDKLQDILANQFPEIEEKYKFFNKNREIDSINLAPYKIIIMIKDEIIPNVQAIKNASNI